MMKLNLVIKLFLILKWKTLKWKWTLCKKKIKIQFQKSQLQNCQYAVNECKNGRYLDESHESLEDQEEAEFDACIVAAKVGCRQEYLEEYLVDRCRQKVHACEFGSYDQCRLVVEDQFDECIVAAKAGCRQENLEGFDFDACNEEYLEEYRCLHRCDQVEDDVHRFFQCKNGGFDFEAEFETCKKFEETAIPSLEDDDEEYLNLEVPVNEKFFQNVDDDEPEPLVTDIVVTDNTAAASSGSTANARDLENEDKYNLVNA